MKMIPWVKVVLSLALCLLLFYAFPMTEAAVFDDIAVASLNDPVASRTMAVNQNLQGLYGLVPYIVMGASALWVFFGWKSNKEKAEA